MDKLPVVTLSSSHVSYIDSLGSVKEIDDRGSCPIVKELLGFFWSNDQKKQCIISNHCNRGICY